MATALAQTPQFRVPAGIMRPSTEGLVGFEAWEAQPVIRSYPDLIGRVSRLAQPHKDFNLKSYGNVVFGPDSQYIYPLHYLTVGDPSNGKPTIWLNAGVHGYEEGAVEGLMAFLEQDLQNYIGEFNFVVVPCVSPAGYERDMRFNGVRLDVNRGYFPDSNVQEAARMMDLVHKLNMRYAMSIDMHETTWSDAKIFYQDGQKIFVDTQSYVIERVREPLVPGAGRVMADAMEGLGLPLITKPGFDRGVLFDSSIKTTNLAFMFHETAARFAPTDRALLTEPYVTRKMFDNAEGMQLRIEAQRQQVKAALDHIIEGRKYTAPSRLVRPRG